LSFIHSLSMTEVWWIFGVLVGTLLLLDLFVFHRKAHEIKFKEALAWTGFWVSLALLFNAFVYFRFGPQSAKEFLAGYLVEEALSVDNLFVFLVLFSYFRVPRPFQHRVLFWGILGALIMRGVFIYVGVEVVERFHWVLYVFGAFLVYTAWKLLRGGEAEADPEKNPIIGLFRRFVPMVNEYEGQRFLVQRDGKRFATPLLLVLVVIEATDVVFAVDSIPAIFILTRDPFIIYTSNIFAILGLRSLYFVLSGAMRQFHYLKYGLGLVLAFIGLKMLVSGFVHVGIGLSLSVIAILLGGSIGLSLLKPAPTTAIPTDEHGHH
jgi:tellurite resistance protein TerC